MDMELTVTVKVLVAVLPVSFASAFGSSRLRQLSKEIFERKSALAVSRIKVNPVWDE